MGYYRHLTAKDAKLAKIIVAMLCVLCELCGYLVLVGSSKNLNKLIDFAVNLYGYIILESSH